MFNGRDKRRSENNPNAVTCKLSQDNKRCYKRRKSFDASMILAHINLFQIQEASEKYFGFLRLWVIFNGYEKSEFYLDRLFLKASQIQVLFVLELQM